MKITTEQIRSVTVGAARVEEQKEAVRFHRFTKEQQDAYELRSEDFFKKTFATAGIRLEFETDSRTLALGVEVTPASSRPFFDHDIYVNDRLIGQLSGTFPTPFDGTPVSRFGEYALGNGTKTVRIYFPWSGASVLTSLCLDDGAWIRPVVKDCRMITFGDSITHGYDAEHPSLSYASLLADALHADARNKGIGGERFWPELATMSDGIAPDYVTVAYGTNDWGGRTREEWIDKATAFYQKLSATYPHATIFALSPIWRADHQKETPAGCFEDLPNLLETIVKELSNVVPIRCLDFLPKNKYAFHDGYLHPNDAGFSFYADGLIQAIQSHKK